jgi:hypothetical protein
MSIKEEVPEKIAMFFVGGVPLLILVDLLFCAKFAWGLKFQKSTLIPLALIVYIVSEVLSIRRYSKFKYDFFAKKWDEAKHHKIFSVLTGAFCSGLIIIPVTFAILEYLHIIK